MTAVEAVQAFWEALTPGFRWQEDFDVLFDIARLSDSGMVWHGRFVKKPIDPVLRTYYLEADLRDYIG